MARTSERSSMPVVITTLLFYGHILIYLLLCWINIKKYQKELYNRYSSLDSINVRWLMLLVGLYAFVIVVALFNSIIGFSDRPYIYEISLIGLVLALLFFASSTLYRALTFPHFFKGIPQQRIRYGNNRLPKETVLKIRKSLYEIVDTNELYKKAYLSLDELANQLHTTPRALSQVLNQELGMTFFDYINKKRIHVAMKMLANPKLKEKTILEIMYNVGFNSKSSFNTAFKKFTGDTPSEYRKKRFDFTNPVDN
jgi:AraC-like DNA-binding protein